MLAPLVDQQRGAGVSRGEAADIEDHQRQHGAGRHGGVRQRAAQPGHAGERAEAGRRRCGSGRPRASAEHVQVGEVGAPADGGRPLQPGIELDGRSTRRVESASAARRVADSDPRQHAEGLAEQGLGAASAARRLGRRGRRPGRRPPAPAGPDRGTPPPRTAAARRPPGCGRVGGRQRPGCRTPRRRQRAPEFVALRPEAVHVGQPRRPSTRRPVLAIAWRRGRAAGSPLSTAGSAAPAISRASSAPRALQGADRRRDTGLQLGQVDRPRSRLRGGLGRRSRRAVAGGRGARAPRPPPAAARSP